MTSRPLLAVSDLQALSFCRRSAYFRVRLGLRPPPTPRMLEGKAVERRTVQRETRRTPARYDVGAARRAFAVRVISHRLGLSGIVDELLETPSGPIPVEIKSGTNRGLASHRDQVLAYAAALEESRGVQVPLGFLVYVGLRADETTVHPVHNTPSRRRRVERLAAELHRISATDALPRPTADRSRCRQCDFRRHCEDVAL